jgi:predicted nucleic acid-binding Zn ribbon protein
VADAERPDRLNGKGGTIVASTPRPTPLAEALASYLQKQGLVKRMQQAGIVEEWATLVGPQIAAVTEPESVTADGVLRVRVASAAWAQELSLMSPRVLARLNDGRKGRVREIRWIAGPLGRRT